MSLTNILGNIAARTLISGIIVAGGAALVPSDESLTTYCGNAPKNGNSDTYLIDESNGISSSDSCDIPKYVLECRVGGKWEDIENYEGKWKNDIYGCKMIELPSVKLGPISL